jgi:hypothetical protein
VAFIDIERIRVAAERTAYAALQREDSVAMRTFVPQNVAAARRSLVSSALLLTETMAPEAHDAARAALAALGVDDEIELYQSAGGDTARLVLFGQPIGIEFIGGYLDRLDRGGLLAVLGHEIGHRLAHCGHPTFRWALSACEYANSPTRRAYSIAAEFTADRFGLLACRDLDAVLRLEMQMAAGRVARSIRFDTEAYLAQCRAVAEQTIESGGIACGSSHPEHYVRGYAEWLFTETDVYREITGVGSGSRSLDEVDVILHKLISPPVTPPSTTAKPLPRGAVYTATAPTSTRTAAVTAAVVGERHRADDEAAASDILTDGARRGLAATRDALASFARSAVPSLRRFADAARDLGTSSEDKKDVDDDDTSTDPLEDDRRDLIARFEELERRSKTK